MYVYIYIYIYYYFIISICMVSVPDTYTNLCEPPFCIELARSLRVETNNESTRLFPNQILCVTTEFF